MKTVRVIVFRCLVLASLALTAACAKLSIPMPSAEHPTLLVLPTSLTNETGWEIYAYDYAYEIVALDSAQPPQKVRFRLPVESGMVIVDNLAPGEYRLSKIYRLRRSPGGYEDTSWPVNRTLSLEAGRITIYDLSFDVRIGAPRPNMITQAADPGLTYYTSLKYLTRAQRNAILSQLDDLPNRHAWQLRRFAD